HQAYPQDPVAEAVAQGAKLVLNASASPYWQGKGELRERMIAAAAKRHGVPILYANQAGGDDELVYDGRSLAFDCPGRLAALGVSMPSRFSSGHSQSDAAGLAHNLGMRMLLVPLEGMHAATLSALAPAFTALEPDATEENLQARLRCQVLMALSNKFGHLLLT